MEFLNVNEVTLYSVKLRELVEGPRQSSTLTLVPRILPDDDLLNKSVPEMALEAERMSPNYRVRR